LILKAVVLGAVVRNRQHEVSHGQPTHRHTLITTTHQAAATPIPARRELPFSSCPPERQGLTYQSSALVKGAPASLTSIASANASARRKAAAIKGTAIAVPYRTLP